MTAEPERGYGVPGRGDEVDEGLDESFPASDPPSGWSGPDRATGGREPAPVPEPIPEADDPGVAAAWERSGDMDGEAPTG